MKAWETHLDERQRKEIEFCQVYARDFKHGTDGHNIRLIVAKLVELLDMGIVPHIVQPPDMSKPSVGVKKPAVLKD